VVDHDLGDTGPGCCLDEGKGLIRGDVTYATTASYCLMSFRHSESPGINSPE
jgi:hypothetical protein